MTQIQKLIDGLDDGDFVSVNNGNSNVSESQLSSTER